MDIGIAIDYLRPGAKYKSCRTYKELFDTWEDETVLPTEQELIDAEPAAILVQQDREAAEFDFEGVLLVIAKAFHNINNRVRVIEGKSEWTLSRTIKELRQL